MIRKLKPEDTGQVMKIWLEGNTGAHHFVPQDYWESQYESVQEQLLQADVYVYVQNKKIKGFAGMAGDYLAGIFIDKKYRSMGIGKELLGHIKAVYPRFSLHVYQKNQRAVRFYLREGLSVSSEGMDEDTAEADYTMIWDSRQ